MNLLKKFLLLFFLFISLFSLTSCKEDEDNRIYLDSNWKYSIEGEKIEYIPISFDKLSTLNKLLPESKGYIWLRTNFYIPSSLKSKELALYMGIIEIADEIYINGHYLGKTGFFPPVEFSEGSNPSAFLISKDFIKYDTQNTLLIKIWVNGYGKIADTPFISDYSDVTNQKIQDNFIKSKIYMIVSYFMLIVSAIYIFLYLLRKTEKSNLSFSRLNFFSSLFLLPVYFGEYSIIYTNKYSYLLLEKIFFGCAAIISTYFAVSFIRDFFYRKDSKKRKIFRITFTSIQLLTIFSARNIPEFLFLMYFEYLAMSIQILYAVRIIFQEIKEKNKRVITLLIGFSPVLIAIILDLFVTLVFKTPFSILFIIIGWIFTIFIFLGILIINFVKMANRVEFINKNLELIVNDRTKMLASTNELLVESNKKLEYEKKRNEKEIELASYVQQSFYKKEIPQYSNWELSYYSKALAGVSGDFWDFFQDEKRLLGLGIFDVSGHGIASGLVTMLVKNIIEQEFYKGLTSNLDDVISFINSRVISEKGNIENYLTGILLRITDSHIEMVNLGHPKAILYNKKKKTASYIENGKNQYGVIGIPDFPINAEIINFKMNKGDELLLYTDGITEAENENKEYYGKDKLLNTFSKNAYNPIETQIEFLKKDIYDFIGNSEVKDDITFVILKKL